MNKAYTSIEQSKKLAEILPLESADMEYLCFTDDKIMNSGIPFIKDGSKGDIFKRIPCWSLAALLNIIHRPSLLHVFNGWRCDAYYQEGEHYQLGVVSDNPVDACVEMIIKLNEQKLL